MSEAINFDTHRFVKRLIAGGFSEQQAEVLAKEQVQLLNSNLATKLDIEAIRADIETAKASVLQWMIGAMIAQGSLVVAFVGLLTWPRPT